MRRPTPPLEIAYLYPDYAPRQAMGAVVRREGFIAGIEANGHRVTRAPLDVREARWLPDVLAGSDPKAWSTRPASAPPDLVIVSGLPEAVRGWRYLRDIPAPVHLDVCDSWLLLSAVGTGERRVIRTAKASLALAGLYLSRLGCTSVSYISELDASTDHDHLRGMPVLVIPNASHVVGSAPPSLDPDGPFVVMGDFAYPPNREMLSTVMQWAQRFDLADGSVRVIGPNLSPSLPPVADVVGWVDHLPDAFQGACGLLAPIATGAGVNNKVLDALAMRVPVFASPGAVKGAPVADPLLIETDHLPSPTVLRRRASHLLSLRNSPVAQITWREAVRPLIDHYTALGNNE